MKEHWQWVDMNAHNCFHGRVGVGTLNCVAGYNLHGRRNSAINKGLVSLKYPRCGEEEDWQHVITCQSIDHLKDQYVVNLESKLGKVAKEEIDREIIQLIIADINQYIRNED